MKIGFLIDHILTLLLKRTTHLDKILCVPLWLNISMIDVMKLVKHLHTYLSPDSYEYFIRLGALRALWRNWAF